MTRNDTNTRGRYERNAACYDPLDGIFKRFGYRRIRPLLFE